MFINHFSSELFPQTYCTTTTKQQQYYSIMDNETTRKSSISPNNKSHEIPKEHMFEKPLTPSDVGKLNRLVIPKQHAEKYFPLNSNNKNNNDNNDSGEKGLLLSFEDELGKIWKFRYSYWNSSQSYVLTKGWSRFVKEKKLESGDVVLFMRHVLDGDRQFIGWRRRSAAVATTVAEVTQPGGVGVGDGGGWGHEACYGGTGNTYPYAGVPYPATGRGDQMQNQTGANGSNTRRQVRLFGVNLAEYEVVDESSWSEPSTPDGSLTSSHHLQSHEFQGQASQHYYQYQTHYSNAHAVPANHHNNMDVNLSRDVNQMRYHQG